MCAVAQWLVLLPYSKYIIIVCIFSLCIDGGFPATVAYSQSKNIENHVDRSV